MMTIDEILSNIDDLVLKLTELKDYLLRVSEDNNSSIDDLVFELTELKSDLQKFPQGYKSETEEEIMKTYRYQCEGCDSEGVPCIVEFSTSEVVETLPNSCVFGEGYIEWKLLET